MITYDRYKMEIRQAHQKIGELSEQLAQAEAHVPEELTWCEECRDYTETDYKVTIKASIDGPEEGVFYCESCGREHQ